MWEEEEKGGPRDPSNCLIILEAQVSEVMDLKDL
jgi:hypothetical protein